MPTTSFQINLDKTRLVPISTEELDQLRELSIHTFEEAFAEANTKEDMRLYTKSAFSQKQLLQEMQDPDITFYFLKQQDILLGYCKIKRGLPSAVREKGPALEICRLYVKQTFQKQGLGQWMLAQIIAKARQKSLDFVWLGVWSQNPDAIRLYERQGFEKIGSYTFMLGRDAQTDFIMKLRLNKAS
ncbi:MAG: GNAT family N-acetyltransferase [Cyclobacteriaceae bacterium]